MDERTFSRKTSFYIDFWGLKNGNVLQIVIVIVKEFAILKRFQVGNLSLLFKNRQGLNPHEKNIVVWANAVFTTVK